MEQDKIWEAFQNDESLIGEFAAEKRLDVIGEYISPGRRVLNIGIGNGYLENLLARKGAVVYCLDPSAKSIERIGETLDLGDRAKVGYSQSIPFPDGLFDFVVMSEVLEHLEDAILGATLVEVKRVLDDGGRFLGTVPADEKLQEGIVVCPGCSQRFHRWGHVQSFSRDRLSTVLSGQFSDIRIHRRTFVDPRRLNWKGKLVGGLKAVQARVGFRGAGQNFVFVASGK